MVIEIDMIGADIEIALRLPEVIPILFTRRELVLVEKPLQELDFFAPPFAIEIIVIGGIHFTQVTTTCCGYAFGMTPSARQNRVLRRPAFASLTTRVTEGLSSPREEVAEALAYGPARALLVRLQMDFESIDPQSVVVT